MKNRIACLCLCLCLYLVTLASGSILLRSTADGTGSQGNKDDSRKVSAGLFESLEELARIVDITYCVGATGTGIQKPFQCLSRCDEFEGFELVTTWNTGPLISDSCGYITVSHPPHPKRIIIAFRGTYSITNAVIDLSAVPQVYVPYPDPDTDPSQRSRCANCTVHAGFLASWQTARDTVLPHVGAALAQYPDYKVVLVGHSLGGAVAALAGLEMQIRGWNPQVTTFGEPRIGNDGLVRFVDEKFNLTRPEASLGLGRRNQRTRTSSRRNVFDDEAQQDQDQDQDLLYRRVTHINDPVPLLPLEEWGYEMHAGEIYISKLDLSPSVSDLELCDGDHDPQCIAGTADEEKCAAIRHLKKYLHRNKQLKLQSLERSLTSQSGEANAEWSLFPARFRLWELFFAHRDYFWRLGLCVPGGDPSHFRGVAAEGEKSNRGEGSELDS